MHDDNSLMVLVKEGDKDAFNELVKKYRISAISFAYSFLFDIYAAEDAVQDVFVNIYLKRADYKPIYEFKTFLYKAVHNKCIDYLRRIKIRTTFDIDNITEAFICSAEETYLQTEKVKYIFKLMNELKNEYKTALYLYAIEGAGYKEIAKIMKKNVSQVKILIYRARKKLKSQYQEVFNDEK